MQKLLLAFGIGTAVHANTYPITFEFDPNTPPNVECPNGAPKLKGLPFGADTAVDDPVILAYTEQYMQCFNDNFLNNVEHMDVSKMFSQLVTDDTQRCTLLSDGAKECVPWKSCFKRWELASNILNVLRVTYTVSEIHPYSMRIIGTAQCKLTAKVGGFLIGHTVCFLSLNVYEFVEHLVPWYVVHR